MAREDNDDDWCPNANDAVQISIVCPDGAKVKPLCSFKPAFTYPIFGEEELVYGYRGLTIGLTFAAHDLRSHIQTIYDEKTKPIGGAKATDIESAFRDFLHEAAFDDDAEYDKQIHSGEASTFTPPGEKIQAYHNGNRNFEIWCASLGDPTTYTILSHMQALVPLFIEGGTEIDLGNPEWTIQRWKVFLVYEVLSNPPPNASKYSIVGYSTSYRIYTLDPKIPPTSLKKNFPPRIDLPISDFRSRERISQFLVLPPYQSQRHGQHLYNTMFQRFFADDTVHEITVEDPNEAFDDLRDYCDIARLRGEGVFEGVGINTDAKIPSVRSAPVPTSKLVSTPDNVPLESVRLKTKMAPRQFSRILEMHLLSQIPPQSRSTARLTRREKTANAADRAYYFWRLLVKHRLYKRNKDQLMQLELEERIEKLEETLKGVESEYLRILEGADRRQTEDRSVKDTTQKDQSERNGSGSKRRAGKRIIDEDGDEDDGAVMKRRKEKAWDYDGQ